MQIYKRIYLEISNICNLNCSFCPITERQKNYMELGDFEATLQKVAPFAEQICLHLMGEPLAHPKFGEIHKICEKYNTQIQLTTNGLLLNKYESLILNSHCIRQINISLQSYMDNFPDRPLEVYLDKIFSFISKALAEKPALYLNLRLWNINEKEAEVNGPIFCYLEEKLSIEINRRLELANIKSKKLVGRLYLHFDSRFDWPRLEMPFQSTHGRCNGLIDHFAIHSDGAVVPCCLDDQKIINLGNIFESSVESILGSERAVAIASGFKNNQLVEDLCQKCTYINRFKR